MARQDNTLKNTIKNNVFNPRTGITTGEQASAAVEEISTNLAEAIKAEIARETQDLLLQLDEAGIVSVEINAGGSVGSVGPAGTPGAAGPQGVAGAAGAAGADGAGGTPGGSVNQIQFNDGASALAASNDLWWDNSNGLLYVSGGINNSNSPVFNVKNYGAAGDGLTDDSVSIQAAITAAGSSTYGGIIYFPAGEYIVGTTLLVTPTNSQYGLLTFRGDGKVTTILRLPVSSIGIDIGDGINYHRYLKFEDIAFSRTAIGTSTVMRMRRVNQFAIFNCHFSGGEINLDLSEASMGTITDSIFSDLCVDTNINMANSVNISIIGCYFENVIQPGGDNQFIHIGSGNYGITINNNKFSTNLMAIEASTGPSTDITITGNTILDCASGIRFTSTCARSLIVGNTVYTTGSAQYGINIENTTNGITTQNNIVTGYALNHYVPGNDIFSFISGAINGKNGTIPTITCFGGDVHVSGNLTVAAGNVGNPTFMPIAFYGATTLTESIPAVAGQIQLSQFEITASSIKLRVVLSTTNAAVSASARLYNITSGSIVDLLSTVGTDLSTSNLTPTSLESQNLIGATNFGTGSNVYELRYFIATGSQSAILGSGMFVCV